MKIKLAGSKDHKILKNDLDEAWRYYIKMRDGLECRFTSIAQTTTRCGKFDLYINKKQEWKIPPTLQAAHILRRQNHRYRWDVKNGIALCAGHHMLFDGLWRDNGKSDELLVQLKILTPDELGWMKVASRQASKKDIKLEMIYMQQRWKELAEKSDDCMLIYEQLVNQGILSV